MEADLEQNEGVGAELAVAQKLLDADLERQEELAVAAEDARRNLLDTGRQLERSKLREDSARRELEELRYTALGRLFPTLDETAKYILTHLFAEARCLACGADAEQELKRLDRAIRDGVCAICGAERSRQQRPNLSQGVIPVHVIEQRKLDRAVQAAATAKTEREAAAVEESKLQIELDHINKELDAISRSIDQQRLANATLRARLPPAPEEVQAKRQAVERARDAQKEYERQRDMEERKYQKLLTLTEEIFRTAAVHIAHRFQRFATAFLEEDCLLSFRLVEDRPSQGGARFMYPSLKFEMSAAAFETRQFREKPDDAYREH